MGDARFQAKIILLWNILAILEASYPEEIQVRAKPVDQLSSKLSETALKLAQLKTRGQRQHWRNELHKLILIFVITMCEDD